MRKLAQHNPFTTSAENPSKLAMEALEAALTSPTKRKFEGRYDEGCDVEDDELYTVWAGLKALTIHECECVGEKTDDKDTRLQPSHHGDSEQVSEVFKQGLVIPKSVPRRRTQRATLRLPPHISGDVAIKKMVGRVEEKQLAEEKKKQRKEERQAKREKDKAKKPKKHTEKAKKRKGCNQSDSEDDAITCPICCKRGSDALWVCCDICDTWYHAHCTDISPDDYEHLENIDWFCFVCLKD